MRKASVCMCTYDRPELLEEAIECFLRQPEDDIELVIVNDRENQELVFEHPRVQITNVQTRFPNTGSKRKYAASLATGEFLMFWDDDDIHLPGHTARCFDLMQHFRGHRISRAQRYWQDTGSRFHMQRARWVHTLCLHRDIYWGVGGHAEIVRNEDTAFIHRLLRAGELAHSAFPVDAPTFIYRQATGRARICSLPEGERHADRWAFVQGEADRRGVSGRIELHPRWATDYAARAASEWASVAPFFSPPPR